MMLRENAAVEASNVPVGGGEGEKQDRKANVDGDSLNITIGRVSIMRDGEIRAILGFSKT